MTDQLIKRSGLDYWKKLNLSIFDSLREFLEKIQGERVFFLSKSGTKSYAETQYERGDILCFGSESSGFPGEITSLAKSTDTLIRIPMIPEARCLNVATAAGIVLYEGLRQILWQ